MGLPRSRTYWLSQFLSYGDWSCYHDEAIKMRSVQDLRTWFTQPNTGSSETSAALYWRFLLETCPELRVVVVRRSVQSAVDSWMQVSPESNYFVIKTLFHKIDRKLDQIEKRMPNVLSVKYDDLAKESTCKEIFEFCLPYEHDSSHWEALDESNLQINVQAQLRYAKAYSEQITKLSNQVVQQERASMARKKLDSKEGVTFQIEKFDSFQDWMAKTEILMQEHMTQTNQGVFDYQAKNKFMYERLNNAGVLRVVTARCNGRMVGYRVSILAGCLEDPNILQAEHTAVFADPAFPGVGAKMAKAGDELLRQDGVNFVLARAGVRGSGPRLGALYRRQGYESIGELYRRELRA